MEIRCYTYSKPKTTQKPERTEHAERERGWKAYKKSHTDHAGNLTELFSVQLKKVQMKQYTVLQTREGTR